MRKPTFKWVLAAVSAVVAAPALAAQFSLTAGLFRFQATDYYYPNFYEEAGYRGTIGYAFGAEPFRHKISLRAAAYPMDDNIFDPALEYSYALTLFAAGLWEAACAPAAGFGVTKFQYPAPYSPFVDHHFAPWVRAGGEATLGRKFIGASTLAGGYDARLLYYLGSHFFKDWEGRVQRFKYVHAPFARLTIRVNDRWSLLGVAGIELGGYYDDHFLTPDHLPKTRPYFEAGWAYTF